MNIRHAKCAGVLAVQLAAVGVAQAQAGWTQMTPAAAWSPRDSAGEVVYDGKMWLFGGFAPDRRNDVWSSPDGINWTQATPAAQWGVRNLPGSLVYNNKMWIMGGAGGGSGPWYRDVWSSTDGANWTLATATAPWAGRSGMGTVVYDNKMWVIGGMGDFDGTDHYNDVWWSTDGTSWTQATAAAPWAKRGMLQSVVFDNKMWVIGGGVYDTSYPQNVGPNYGDVWWSTDGINWTEATPFMNAGDRRFHASVVYDNRMWIVAGYTSVPTPGNKNDVWSSPDGINWTQLPTSPWPLRHEVSLYTFNDAMYMAGGFGSVLYNDVWKYVAPSPNTNWTAPGSGDWNLSANWSNGVPNATNAVANFTGAGGAKTIFNNGAIIVSKAIFNTAAAHQITGQGTLTLQTPVGDALIDVQQGHHDINLNLTIASNTDINVAAASSLTISDPVRMNPGTTLTKDGPGTLSFLSTINATGAATIVLSNGVMNLDSINTDPDITFVLNPSAAMIVDYDGEMPIQQMRSMIAAGQIASQSEALSVGYTSTENTALLAMLVAPGDSNLDGQVNITDLNILAANWNEAGVWGDGDVNYDGIVNITDLELLAPSWDRSDSAGFYQALNTLGLPSVAVPEPTTAIFLLAGLLPLRRRRVSV